MEVSQRRRFMHKILSMVMAVTMICTMMCGTVIPASASDYGFVNPISGTVQGAGYDESAGHYGIDLYPYNYGDPVYAVASGTITYSCEENHTKVIQTGDDCGSVKILLDEPFSYNGYTYVSAFYTHMSDLVYDIYCGFNSGCIADYNVGERDDALESGAIHVEAGEIIGYVGKGNAATHLHLSFETGEDSNYHMMPNSEYYEVFGWSYKDSITAGETTSVSNTVATTYTSGLTLAQLQAKFPAGAYWNGGDPNSYTWSPCVCHGRSTCGYADDCTCNGYTYNGTEYAWQCMGFAYKLQQDAYGGHPYGWDDNYDYTSAMANLKPGDVVRYNGHSIFITYVSGDYIEYADCNSTVAGNCGIRWGAHNQTKSSLKSGFSYVTHAPYALSGGTTVTESCTCSTSYAGTYTCTTSSYPLTIRSGHGTSYSAIGSIPSGATVTVTKANGSWAHVEYGGISGYASMEYLAKVQNPSSIYPVPFKCYPLSDAEHAADAYDAVNGNHIGYIYGTDYCTVKEVYTNGWCLVNCPWDSSTKDVYTWTGNFLNTSCSPYTKVVEATATTYIRLGSSSELGWVDPGDQVTIVDDTYSSRKQIIYPHTDGTYRCAWIDATALVHTHTPGTAATCTSPQVCTTCDAILVNEKGHSPGTAATCTNDQTCTACGVILNVAKGHIPGVAATCTTAQTCTTCGVTLVNATGHSYTASDYTDPVHPHIIYNRCACGARKDSGNKATITSCAECYPAPTVAGITYTPSTVKVGDTVTFILNATGATAYQIVIGDGTNVLMRTDITSDNTATYTFNTEGSYLVWGYAYNGETSATSSTIYVTVGSANIPVTGISLNTSSASISVDETITLTATVSPSDAIDKSVTWTSSDVSVATVVNGMVTGVKAGTATITVTTADGGFTASCVVEVENTSTENAEVIFTISDVTGRPGDTVEVDISVNSAVTVNSIGLFELVYDSSILTFTGFTNTENILSKCYFDNGFDENAKVITLALKNKEALTGDICTLEFTIAEDAEDGMVIIKMDSLVKCDSMVIISAVEAGTVNIQSQLLGDINGDNFVDINDAAKLFQYSMLPEIYPITYVGDVDFNNDGVVDINDAARLFQYSMLPDIYPIS